MFASVTVARWIFDFSMLRSFVPPAAAARAARDCRSAGRPSALAAVPGKPDGEGQESRVGPGSRARAPAKRVPQLRVVEVGQRRLLDLPSRQLEQRFAAPLTGGDGALRGRERAHQAERLGTGRGVEVGVAAGERQAVGFAKRRDPDDLDVEAEVEHQSADQCQLLEILPGRRPRRGAWRRSKAWSPPSPRRGSAPGRERPQSGFARSSTVTQVW